MKRIVMIGLCAAAFAAYAGNKANPDAIELMPIPVPVEFKADMDRPVAFDGVTVACPDEAAVTWLRNHFAEWYGANAPKVMAGLATGASPEGGDEAYAVTADDAGVRIAANSLKGVRFAAYDLRQIAIAKRGTMKTEGLILPTLAIRDKPLLAFRGVHLCSIPPVTNLQIEKAIRLAAIMKFNYCVLECWGTYRSEKHPWWSWPDATMTIPEIKRLAAIGRDLGITLIPQINVFGHASLARACSAKHAILDLHPEYEPLFEPGGWNWCLSNPAAQQVLRDLIAEMHEAFGNPPYFHLGCDEAQPPACPECRKEPYGDLVCRHISGLVDFVAKRGAKSMIWHDMLIKRGDPKWKGYVAMGSDTTIPLADTLPKDVIICDWQYGYGAMDKPCEKWPTFEHFIGKGFRVCACPWMNYKQMKAQADFMAKNGGFGYLQTTWHHLKYVDWNAMYVHGSAAAWGTEAPEFVRMMDTRSALLFRMVGKDMKLTRPEDTSWVHHQIPPEWWIDN